MNKEIEDLCVALESLAGAVEKGWSDNRSLNEAFGWHHPAIDRTELAYIPLSLSKRIRKADLNIDDEDLLEILEKVPAKLERIKSSTLPYFYNGNGQQAIPAYISTLEWISSLIEPELTWVIHNDPSVLPPAISRKLKGLSAKINEIEVDQDKLTKQIQIINDATETAESLPADLQDLKEARKKVESIGSEAIKTAAKISTAKENVDNLLSAIKSNKEESDKLVENCEDSYRITTSKGLAGAFDQRASQLAKSMWVWVFGLLGALVSAWFIGTGRVEALTSALSVPDPKLGLVFGHIFLSIVSLGAPLWFAWLSTKQIGQRFKLAEDYGYKASVAKAYEGYRKEAARIDENLEARLFESALSRVEEAPLRLVEDGGHGSPWHELANSNSFKEALKNIPEFRDRVFELANSAIDRTKRKPDLHAVNEAKPVQQVQSADS
ncbi:hypothetical protein [Rheinheimera baltica]|uniref:hypothetical protein n=1 Tax=Rheinheimera baltica TaxID=67576 RepID=UPI00040BEEE8|nr:hypothetical protein [Rheinheimera baltica]